MSPPLFFATKFHSAWISAATRTSPNAIAGIDGV
jgi:hypothetical protein